MVVNKPIYIFHIFCSPWLSRGICNFLHSSSSSFFHHRLQNWTMLHENNWKYMWRATSRGCVHPATLLCDHRQGVGSSMWTMSGLSGLWARSPEKHSFRPMHRCGRMRSDSGSLWGGEMYQYSGQFQMRVSARPGSTWRGFRPLRRWKWMLEAGIVRSWPMHKYGPGILLHLWSRIYSKSRQEGLHWRPTRKLFYVCPQRTMPGKVIRKINKEGLLLRDEHGQRLGWREWLRHVSIRQHV